MESPPPGPRDRKVYYLVISSLFVHLLIMSAALDIYFSSPIDHGMTPVRSTDDPPAKRVVFIVADGLRAEKIFGKGQAVKAPHLTKIRKMRAAWGTAYSRVPTESRTGYAALLAGVYEDPSALLLGWRRYPVDFDSVINQSTNSWSWGSPNVVRMFNKDNASHVHSYSYNASLQDFGQNNTTVLDIWVFDKVRAFIQEQINCSDCVDFRQSGNIFFLHLFGLDTAGHKYKPDSLEYINNIKTVDSYVPVIEELFEKAFPDKSTAYIFTADHGMTNWGTHGYRSHHETKIPVIAWGAGIKTTEIPIDIRQIDVAPLISALIGINFPTNSIGILPYDYISSPLENVSNMMIANVRQIMETFIVKKHKRMDHAIHFVPYYQITEKVLKTKLLHLEVLLKNNKHDVVRRECEIIAKFLIKGMDYYDNYYQLPILIAITIGIVAWILFVATYNVPIRRNQVPKSIIKFINIFLFAPTYLNALFVMKLQAFPLTYYLYFLFPICMIQVLINRYPHIVTAMRYVKNFGLKNTVCSFILYVGGLRLLVQGFRDREALCVVMYFMAASVTFSTSLRNNTNKQQKMTWIFCCVMLSVFPFMPLVKTTFNIIAYLMGYALWWLVVQKFVIKLLQYPFYELERVEVVDLQLTILKVTPVYTFAVEMELVAADSFVKYLAWIWAFYPIVMIPCTTNHILVRTTSIFIGFIPFYLMVTTNYEILFLIIYVLLLYTWFMIESKCYGYETIYRTTFDEVVVPDRNQTRDDFRRAFFFIILIFIGFFGTGNIASLNSFDPTWARCFLTDFTPLKTTGLIMLRIMIPFIFTSCVFKAINIFRKGSTIIMFSIVLMFADLMLLELFFCITNIGSWLEIGMSLSYFIIMELFVLMLLILYGLAYFLTTLSYTIKLNHYLSNL
ncbi:GPI ethanolamine phosphate transferase 1-like [Tenebrio molitor]|uniref:GPI ethanolamine phosphate transferase 1-like n=1 Tax=Tenebrio molitor TaxID=7067 RepID=UPI003624856A